MKSYAIKLIELLERDKEKIAKQWYHYVIKNPRTKSIFDYADSDMIDIASSIYGSFREMYLSDNLKETATEIFGKYAEALYKKGVPPEEAVYALILLRRHIWVYSEFRDVFASFLKQQEKENTLIRTMLIFDYAFYAIVEKYEALSKGEK